MNTYICIHHKVNFNGSWKGMKRCIPTAEKQIEHLTYFFIMESGTLKHYCKRYRDAKKISFITSATQAEQTTYKSVHKNYTPTTYMCLPEIHKLNSMDSQCTRRKRDQKSGNLLIWWSYDLRIFLLELTTKGDRVKREYAGDMPIKTSVMSLLQGNYRSLAIQSEWCHVSVLIWNYLAIHSIKMWVPVSYLAHRKPCGNILHFGLFPTCLWSPIVSYSLVYLFV